MGRKAAPRKYGVPLYCAAWPAGEHLFVAGGGGKKGFGIGNRRATSCVQLHRQTRLSNHGKR